jgi:3-mercaptopyruvate sulfurtransferase SseA
MELGGLSVFATPTLLLLDPEGRIKKVWTGMLSPDGEAEVFKSLGLERVPAASEEKTGAATVPDPSGPNLMSAAQMIGLRQRKKRLPIIDVRPLEEFQKGHIAGSINIPQDEFEARISHEIPKGGTVVIYCHYCAPCELQKESAGVATYCTISEQWLEKLGYADVKILSDDLHHLQTAGIPTIGSSAEQFVSGNTPVVE